MSIEFIPAICPKCGGELRVPNNVDVIKCMYCGADIILHDSSKIRIETAFDGEKYLVLAERAVAAENYKEAYKYATLILEQEPLSREAILIKGFAAGMLSSPDISRIKEAKECLKLVLGKEQSELSEKDIESDNSIFKQLTDIKTKKIVYGYLLKIANHLEDISSQLWNKAQSLKRVYGVKAPDEEPDIILLEATKHNENAFDFYIKAYGLTDESVEWKHTNPPRERLRDMIKLLLNQLLNGRIRWHEEQIEFDKQLAVHGVAVGEKLRIEMSNVYAVFRKHVLSETDLIDDPEFINTFKDYENRILEIEKKEEEEKCFIATATMADINHPYVCVLKDYRDRILSRSTLGKLFISVYYFLSPPLAKIISRNQVLKDISQRCIVLPAYNGARRAVEKSETCSE